jgi:hypothetical protein
MSASKILAVELSRRRHDSSGRRRPAVGRRSDSFVTAVRQREQTPTQSTQLNLLSKSTSSAPRRQSAEEQRYSQQLVQQQQQQQSSAPSITASRSISPPRASTLSRRSTLSYSVHLPSSTIFQPAVTPRSRHISTAPSPASLARPNWQECDITESLLVSRLVPALSS